MNSYDRMELSHFKATTIYLEPNKSALIHECKEEALQVALQYKVAVVFMFNGIAHRVDYTELYNCVRQNGQGN